MMSAVPVPDSGNHRCLPVYLSYNAVGNVGNVGTVIGREA
jgi:hypothetical protein